jgi:hypothetical protein
MPFDEKQRNQPNIDKQLSQYAEIKHRTYPLQRINTVVIKQNGNIDIEHYETDKNSP